MGKSMHPSRFNKVQVSLGGCCSMASRRSDASPAPPLGLRLTRNAAKRLNTRTGD